MVTITAESYGCLTLLLGVCLGFILGFMLGFACFKGHIK